MATRSSVEAFLAEHSLALAGVSRRAKGFGRTVLSTLKDKGYDVLLVHPEATEIDGAPCYPSLAALPRPVGGLVAVVPPAQTETLVREAHAAGIRRVWMQQGAESTEAIRYCEEHGVDVVHGECILMFAQPTGAHRFHRWVRGVFGKLPAEDPAP